MGGSGRWGGWALQQPKDGFFTTADVKIHYLAAGGAVSWVVLIHGYTTPRSACDSRPASNQKIQGDIRAVSWLA